MSAYLWTLVNPGGRKYRDVLASVYMVPLAISVPVAAACAATGHALAGCAVAAAGVGFVTVITHFIPITTLEPRKGEFQPSLQELPHVKGSDPTDYQPPLGAFYPTTEKRRGTTHWLPFYDVDYFRGLTNYFGFPFFYLRDLRLTQIRLQTNAAPASLYRPDGTQRPIFVHSHGLVQFGRFYSVFLASLAAQGAVCIAVNHMDKSGSFCRDATNTFRIPFRMGLKLCYADRIDQLRTRVQEVHNTIGRVLDGSILRQLGYPEDEVKRYTSHNPQVVLVGHSFGGATALATAHEEERRQRSGKQNYMAAIAGVVAHDPWHMPLWGRFTPPETRVEETADADLQASYTPATGAYSTPTLQHHSQEWQLDRESWELFTNMDKVVHAQLQHPEHLTPEQRTRIERATARMREAEAVGAWSHASDDWFVVRREPGTAHLAVSDAPSMTPHLMRMPYQTNRPLEPIYRWAEDARQFAEIHTDASRTKD